MPAKPHHCAAYRQRLRERALTLHYRRCRVCGRKSGLEFAHRIDDGVTGIGRGMTRRYLAIIRNPGAYYLLCKKHHVMFDSGLIIVPNYKMQQCRK